ncbi:MAG: YicC family protein [Prevotellaceae bacterium]|nr:YicC family protein [Prevotellaceae bacterium]
MTGYGKAEQLAGQKKITVELRSLNSKTLDLNLKIPTEYREKESAVRNELFRVVQRGKLEVQILSVSQDAALLSAINDAAFLAYYRRLDGLLKQAGSSAAEAGVAQAILRMPDVLTEPSASDVPEEEWAALSGCLQQALDAFGRFRAQEGIVLECDILMHVTAISALLEEVKTHEPQRLETLRQRMVNSLETLLQTANYDKNRFEQELIYYIEKFDITEEKTRLKQHCDYFCQTVATEEASGRKLGFIAQEMGREINTLGSKANHAGIQKIVVQMKDELEKIKEQLLNVL